jgi:hypothetical protein
MNTKLTAFALVTATALSLAPKPAVASDKGLALIGGFIGGMVVASALNDSHHVYADPAPAVVVADRGDYGRPDGYWKFVTVRVWVPGYWVVERTRHGRSFRRYVEGHNEFRTDRVWVSLERRAHVVYGYGR